MQPGEIEQQPAAKQQNCASNTAVAAHTPSPPPAPAVQQQPHPQPQLQPGGFYCPQQLMRCQAASSTECRVVGDVSSLSWLL